MKRESPEEPAKDAKPKKLKTEKDAKPKKLKRSSRLGDVLGKLHKDLLKSPLMKLNIGQFVRILDAKPPVEERSSKEENSESSDLHDDNEPFILDYDQLSDLACTCKAMAAFFCQETFGNGFVRLADDRISIQGVEPHFDFFGRYLTEIKVTDTIWSSLYFLVNTEGFPPCEHCGTNTWRMRGKAGVPIAPFLAQIGSGKRKRKADLSKCKTVSEQNLAILEANRKYTYLCMNPKCRKPLDQVICNFPLGSIFDACSNTHARGKHETKKLDLQLYTYRGREIDESMKYCVKCGVLTTKKANLLIEADCGGFCHPVVKKGQPLKCICVPCTLCKRMPAKCKCEPCGECKKCGAKKCKLCKDKCECEPPYCPDCLNEICEC